MDRLPMAMKEKYKDFTMPHGMCVGLGCISAAAISMKRGYIGPEELYEIRDVCVMFGLPMFVDGIDDQEILRITKSDKKMIGGHIRFILLKEIGKAAFFECTGLTSVVIGNSVKEIEKGAFAGCTDLTSITIPDSLTEIGEIAFPYGNGTSLKSIIVPSHKTDYFKNLLPGYLHKLIAEQPLNE